MKTTYDIESYPNHTLLSFQDMESGGFSDFTLEDITQLRTFVKGRTLIGYNNHAYDDKILVSILEGEVKTDADAHRMTQQIIDNDTNKALPDRMRKNLNQVGRKITDYCKRSIDLRKAIHQQEGSLKALAIKYKMESVEDLPFPPITELSEEQKEEVRLYCRNDIAATAKLAELGRKKLNLREYLSNKFGISVHSEGAPGCAEKIIIHTHRERTGSPGESIWIFTQNVRRNLQRHDSIKDFMPQELINPKFKDKGAQLIYQAFNDAELPCIDGQPETGYLNHKPTLFGLSLSTGAGGLHSIDKAGVYDNVVDYDVASYYPSIMVRFKIRPRQLDKEFTEILTEMLRERLEAKRSGDLVKADALKLILNSVFGKFNNKHSALFDPKAMLAVTTTGQILLLKLIEMMNEAGVKVIGANTDGIQVQTEDRDASDQVAQEWMDMSGLSLESTEYRKLLREHGNSYLAIKTDGTQKAKGRFNTQGKPSYNIIKIAKNRWFAEGIDPEKTIKECRDLHQFIDCYTAPKNMEVFAGEKMIQQSNRWYRSTDSTTILYKNNKNNDNRSKEKIPKAEQVTVCNRIGDFPKDIDYAWYIAQTREEINAITKITAPPGEMALLAEKMRKNGFIPLPKNGKKNARGSKLRQDMVWDHHTYNDHPNLGFINGTVSGMFTVDIDNPEKLDIPIDLLQTGMVVYRRDGTGQDVRDGKLRGSITFRSHLCKYIKNAKRVKNKGFEILNISKTTTCAGEYKDSTYRMEGVPEHNYELEEYLREVGILKIDEEFEESLSECPSAPLDHEENLREVLSEILPDSVFRTKESQDGYMLLAKCPYGDMHENGINSKTDFGIHVRPGRVSASCFHESCSQPIRMINERLTSAISEIREQTPVEFTIPDDRDETARCVFDAINNEAPAKLINSPTGTGKSWSASKTILHNHKRGRKTLVVVSTKDEMRQMGEILCQQADIADPSDIGVTMVKKGVSRIPDKITTIITHHQYLRRMGISRRFLTATAKWIDENAGEIDVIIDEGQAFIRSLTINTQISSRYSRSIDNNGHSIYRRIEKCPARRASTNEHLACGSCFKGYHSTYLGDGYGNQIIEQSQVIVGDLTESPGDIRIPALNYGASAEFGTFLMKEIKTSNAMLYSTRPCYESWEKEDTPKFNEEIINLINCSYRPYIAKNTTTTRESDGGTLYPTYPCEIETLVTQDRLPLFYLKGAARSITFMGASFDEQSIQFLKQDFGEDLKIYSIDEGYETLDQVVIVETKENLVASGKIPPSLIDLGKDHGIKALIFTNKRSHMHQVRSAWGDQDDNLLSFDESRYMKEYGNRKGDYETILTYSRSSLGRGINVPECDIVISSAESYRPTIGVTPTDFTQEAFQKAQKDEAIETLLQNAGRILRGKGRKVIIIQGSDHDRNGDIGKHLQRQLQASYKKTMTSYIRADFAGANPIVQYSADFINQKINTLEVLAEESLTKRRNRHAAYAELSVEEQEQKTREAIQKKAKRIKDKFESAKREGAGWKSVQRRIRGWKGITPLLPSLRSIYLKDDYSEEEIANLFTKPKQKHST